MCCTQNKTASTYVLNYRHLKKSYLYSKLHLVFHFGIVKSYHSFMCLKSLKECLLLNPDSTDSTASCHQNVLYGVIGQ